MKHLHRRALAAHTSAPYRQSGRFKDFPHCVVFVPQFLCLLVRTHYLCHLFCIRWICEREILFGHRLMSKVSTNSWSSRYSTIHIISLLTCTEEKTEKGYHCRYNELYCNALCTPVIETISCGSKCSSSEPNVISSSHTTLCILLLVIP